MAFQQQINNAAYGLSNALAEIFPAPIVAEVPPTASDFAEIGTIWIDRPNSDAYILTNNIGGSSTWTPVGGGPGEFTNIDATGYGHFGTNVTAGTTITAGTGLVATTGGLTVTAGGASITGTTNINTSGAAATSLGTGTGAVTIGNVTGATGITGTTVSLTGAVATSSTLAVGTGLTLTAGNITLSGGVNSYVGTGGGARLYSGTGNPVLSAAKGSLYMKTDASTTTDRLWINTNGTTGWTFITADA